MEAVDHCDTSDVILKLAVLLHDLGKPYTQTPKEGCIGEFTFYDHGAAGAELADKWLRAYKFSNEERSRVVHLVRHHGAGAYYTKRWSKRAIRRFINKIGVENLNDFFTIRIADLRGKGKDSDELLELVVDLAVKNVSGTLVLCHLLFNYNRQSPGFEPIVSNNNSSLLIRVPFNIIASTRFLSPLVVWDDIVNTTIVRMTVTNLTNRVPKRRCLIRRRASNLIVVWGCDKQQSRLLHNFHIYRCLLRRQDLI